MHNAYGYFATPGYPGFYPKLNCSWSIEADEGQTIQLSVLDADIKPPKVVELVKQRGYGNYQPRTVCIDALTASEETGKLFTICGNSLQNLQTIRTESNRLNISFESSDFSPTRGVLLRYFDSNCVHVSVEGCQTLPAPRKGHLVYRNGSQALYTCCKNHVFEDTKELTKYLYCLHGVQWNATLTQCIRK
ncbi:mannan-binding lectin serine protease 2-like protein, partial [Leptotrombidium deliense]